MTEKIEDHISDETSDLESDLTDEVQETEDTQQGGTPVEESDDKGKAHREAAKYRTQLRETETALDTMTGQRNNLATLVVESHLPGHVPPRAFWKLADDVTSYITDDGTVDKHKVKAAADAIAEDLGLPSGPVIPGQEKRPSNMNTGNQLHQAFEPH